MSESMRMQKGGSRRAAGNLALVLKSQTQSGTDKDRLCILSSNNKDNRKLTNQQGKQIKYGQVVRREGDTYVMIPDGAEHYTQQLTLDKRELESLRNAVREVRLGPENKPKKTWLEVSDKVTNAQGLCDKVIIRQVTVRYEDAPKDEDVKLVVKKGGVFVHTVGEEGFAAAQHVQRGQEVVAIYHDDEGCFEDVDLEDLPNQFFEASDVGAVRSVGLFPLILMFDVLPAGWRIRSCGAEGEQEQPLDKAEDLNKKVNEAIQADSKLVITFEKDAEVEVNRYDYLVRHEHTWEADVKSATEECSDKELLKEWGVGAKMTAHQVCFAFQSLMNEIDEKLQAFDDQKDNFRRMLKEKCKRCVETRKRYDREKAAKQHHKAAQTDRELENNRVDVHAVCEEVPLWFLRELQKEADEKKEAHPEDPTKAGKLKHHSGNAKKDEGKTIHHHEVWEEMSTQISQYLEELKDKGGKGGKAGAKKALGGGKDADIGLQPKFFPHPPENAGGNSTDGRLNAAEFEKCLYNAGISWLDRRDIQEKFSAMDVDKSGKLNLAEVLSAATRIMELVKQAQIWGEEQARNHKKIPQEELLNRYSMHLWSEDMADDGGDGKKQPGLHHSDTAGAIGGIM